MNQYESVNILDMINAIGEEEVKNILSDFSCPLKEEIEYFVRNNALEFAKRKMSITYLVIDENSRVLAVYTLAHKAIQLLNVGLTNSMRKKLNRYARLDETTDSYTLSAFLIAQFGKNYAYGDSAVMPDNELMDMTMCTLKGVQWQIGGGVVYLECEERLKLLEFYQNKSNHYQIFGERLSEKDAIKYIQLIRIF